MGSTRSRIRVVSAELVRDGHYLITQRRADAVLPLLWEFPGGRVWEGEEDEQALRRALRDRLGVEVTVQRQTMEFVHGYETYDLELAVYRCSTEDEPEPVRVADARWVRLDQFGSYEFPGADQLTVDQLLASME
jgi:8-oxo-dGTP diphosphatase